MPRVMPHCHANVSALTYIKISSVIVLNASKLKLYLPCSLDRVMIRGVISICCCIPLGANVSIAFFLLPKVLFTQARKHHIFIDIADGGDLIG